MIMRKEPSKNKIFNFKKIGLITLDVLVVVLSMFGALFLRFKGVIEPFYLGRLKKIGLLIVFFDIAIFYYKSFYNSLWTYAEVREFKNIVKGTLMTSIINIVVCELTFNSMPRSCYFIFFLLVTMLAGGYRYMYQYFSKVLLNKKKNVENISNVMIVGAGAAGKKIAREIITSRETKKKVVCFIDDNPSKKGLLLNNIAIYGNRNLIKEAVRKFDVDEIYVAIPSATKKQITEILNICNETGKHTEVLPKVFQLTTDEIKLSDLRKVELEDLLEKVPIEVNLEEIIDYIYDRIVLVTGGGGSIGCELCRQIVKCKPKKLIILDIYENNTYKIQLELQKDYPDLDLDVLIASIRDEGRINSIFKKYKPDIVYHAAAHKHVPLMEDSPNEAVKNNVFGTYNIAEACYRYEVEKMVLISSDKAVNPVNIMGATKRICEMIIQAYANKSKKTKFTAVRFGNVLGSSGSVVNIFKQQIAEGGPVTVTDPNIIRYFMTIPEAVLLVLQAGYYAEGGEIFVFDMGKQVKILDIAKKLIRLYGYEPYKDIPIIFTGLRSGEKLYEELLMAEEYLQETPNHLIRIAEPIEMNYQKFFQQLTELKELAYQETDQMKEIVSQLVETYRYKNEDV